MTVKDLLGQEICVDVYDNYDERLGIAFDGPIYLTEEGEKEFNKILNAEIDKFDDNAIVDTPNEERAELAKRLFNSLAGYCSEENWNKWFSYSPIEADKPYDKSSLIEEISTIKTDALSFRHPEAFNVIDEIGDAVISNMSEKALFGALLKRELSFREITEEQIEKLYTEYMRDDNITGLLDSCVIDDLIDRVGLSLDEEMPEFSYSDTEENKSKEKSDEIEKE